MDDDTPKPAPPNMAWLLTFADLVSLLITFFVLLYSMKVVNTQKWDELKGTFSGVFSIRQPIYEIRPDKDTTVEKVDPVKADRLEYIYSLLSHAFAKDDLLRDSKIIRDNRKGVLEIQLSNAVLFEEESAVLAAEGEKRIRILGDILRHLDNRIEVAGHTGRRIVRNRTYPSNWELSILRAISVSKILEEQGVEKKIVSSGYGYSLFDEVNPNLSADERNKEANRVEIIVHQSQDM